MKNKSDLKLRARVVDFKFLQVVFTVSFKLLPVSTPALFLSETFQLIIIQLYLNLI